jgi:hypothetical protein
LTVKNTNLLTVLSDVVIIFLRNKQFTGTINIMSILAVNTIYKHEKSLCNSFINFHFRMFVHKSNYNLLIGTYTQKCENKGIYTMILILTQEILVLKILPKM